MFIGPTLGIVGQRGGGASRLIRPGWISPTWTFARAQAGGAMAAHYDGSQWREDAADTPRFGPALKIEGQRTNAIRNPRGDGLVAGTPGIAPTYWTLSIGFGLSIQLLALTTIAGAPHVRARVFGTANTSTNFAWSLDAASATTVSSGQVWTSSASLGLTIASGSTPSAQLTNREFQSDGATLVTSDSSAPALSLSETPARFSRSTTMAASSARLAAVLRMSVTNGQAYDFTMFIGWPTLELGSFASTPILPAVGTPAAATRGADLLSAPLARLGIRDSGACTMLGTFMIPQAAASFPQNVFQIDSGNDVIRYLARSNVGASALTLYRLAPGAAQASVGSVTLGSPFRFGMSVDAAGRAAASIDGGSVAAVTGGPTSGLTHVRVGMDSGGTENLFGDIAYLDVLPYPVSDAQLQALVAAMPLS